MKSVLSPDTSPVFSTSGTDCLCVWDGSARSDLFPASRAMRSGDASAFASARKVGNAVKDARDEMS